MSFRGDLGPRFFRFDGNRRNKLKFEGAITKFIGEHVDLSQ